MQPVPSQFPSPLSQSNKRIPLSRTMLVACILAQFFVAASLALPIGEYPGIADLVWSNVVFDAIVVASYGLFRLLRTQFPVIARWLYCYAMVGVVFVAYHTLLMMLVIAFPRYMFSSPLAGVLILPYFIFHLIAGVYSFW